MIITRHCRSESDEKKKEKEKETKHTVLPETGVTAYTL
jgi:hypothetical protein